MRLALVTTTINVPTVLKLYRSLGFEVHFFIIGDRKSPGTEITEFLQDIPNCTYYSIDQQYELGFECARLIPENCIQRRNIGFLAALRWGADAVVSIDDDNSPLTYGYFDYISYAFSAFNGLQVSSPQWFDPGSLLVPPSRQRGFPISVKSSLTVSPITGAKVGVVAGACLGDPDVDAVTRISGQPDVHQVSELLRAGVVVDPNTWTIFNSQNTAVLREFVPAWFMWPHVGRYDDIFASLVVQRVMRSRGYCVHHGQPFVWQQRNPHSLLTDLKAEMLGMEHVKEFAEWIGHPSHSFRGSSLLDDVQQLMVWLRGLQWFPEASIAAGEAWLRDCERAMQ